MRKREGAQCGTVSLRMRSSLKFRPALTRTQLLRNAMFLQFNFRSINKTEKKQIQGEMHIQIFISNLDINVINLLQIKYNCINHINTPMDYCNI